MEGKLNGGSKLSCLTIGVTRASKEVSSIKGSLEHGRKSCKCWSVLLWPKESLARVDDDQERNVQW